MSKATTKASLICQRRNGQNLAKNARSSVKYIMQCPYTGKEILMITILTTFRKQDPWQRRGST